MPRAGEAVPEVVEQIDLTATILDYCGVQVPRFVQGCSLRPLLDGSGAWHKSSALTEAFSEYGAAGSVTLQTARYLYGCDTGGRELLYDKREDPAELCDVVSEERYAAGARRAAPPAQRAAAAGALQRPAAGGALLNQERSPLQGDCSCTSSSS